MKRIYIVVLLLVAMAVVVGYMQMAKPYLENRTIVTVVPTVIAQPALDFEFSFPSGEDAYTSIEPPVPEGAADGLKKVFLMFGTAEYITYQQKSDEVKDTPKSVSIFVFDEVEETAVAVEVTGEGSGRVTRLQNWAAAHPQYTSFASMTSEPQVIDLDGVTALQYRAQGVHNLAVTIALHRGNIYVFTGQFDEESDPIYTMYTGLISSILFY